MWSYNPLYQPEAMELYGDRGPEGAREFVGPALERMINAVPSTMAR
jgi:hypothetical protein